MSAVFENEGTPRRTRELALLAPPAPGRVLAWRGSESVDQEQFLRHVQAAAAALPNARYAVNLCEDRYAFLVAFCAVLVRGQINLLPHTRAAQTVAELQEAWPDNYCLSELVLDPPPRGLLRFPVLDDAGHGAAAPIPAIPADRVVAIGFTSGSTGKATANPKTWGSFHASTALNRAALQVVETLGADAAPSLVATVPPQHMYGLELSVLLPLLGGIAVHSAKPFFPADVAAALAQIPAPRLLVTTPIHLRTLLQNGIALPALAAILCATAPLPVELAQAAEAHYGAPLLEIFGSTETCVIATRRTARQESWQLYPGIALEPQPDGTLVHAPYYPEPVVLADIVELQGARHFQLCGRNADLLEIAGKRASLGELTRRLLAIPGVEDGVVFQPDADSAGVRRIAALVVAPTLSVAAILAALRAAIDPVFLPRPLRRVTRLPRNDCGKLPRHALLAVLQGRD